MQERIIYKNEAGQQADTRKVESEIQRAFLNMLYERGILKDNVHSLAMRRIAEGV